LIDRVKDTCVSFPFRQGGSWWSYGHSMRIWDLCKFSKEIRKREDKEKCTLRSTTIPIYIIFERTLEVIKYQPIDFYSSHYSITVHDMKQRKKQTKVNANVDILLTANLGKFQVVILRIKGINLKHWKDLEDKKIAVYLLANRYFALNPWKPRRQFLRSDTLINSPTFCHRYFRIFVY
jgi:hypothetical protein